MAASVPPKEWPIRTTRWWPVSCSVGADAGHQQIVGVFLQAQFALAVADVEPFGEVDT
jgi:hypothetical protein